LFPAGAVKTAATARKGFRREPPCRPMQDAACGSEPMFRAMLCGLFAESDDSVQNPEPEDAITRLWRKAGK
jgi:hypothetical protein